MDLKERYEKEIRPRLKEAAMQYEKSIDLGSRGDSDGEERNRNLCREKLSELFLTFSIDEINQFFKDGSLQPGSNQNHLKRR